MAPTDLVAQKIPVDRKAIADLHRLKEDFNAVVESLELQSDKAFMKSYAQAKRQIKARDFGDADEI